MNTRYIARHINYFHGKPGHEFVLVFENEVQTVGKDRDWHKLLDRPDLVGLISKAPKTEWCGMAPLLDKDGTSYVEAKPSKDEAAKALRLEAAALKAEAVKEATDPAYALEKALKCHDWYAHYSDDYGVYAASERHWDTIKGLLAKVSPEVGDALVVKYKPA